MAIETINAQSPAPSAESECYRQNVIQLLTQLSHSSGVHGEIETQQLFDTQHDHYLLLSVGWRGQERVYGVAIHLDIRGGKIWIQRNQTELDLEAELIRLGIPQGDIVRGLIPPQYRALAGLDSAG